MLVEVAELEELQEGIATVVVANGRELIVVRWRDKVYALRNICPHQSTPFTSANRAVEMGASPVHTRVTASGVGELVKDDEPLITCPWHAWAFKLGDGQCVADPNLRVRSYTTRVEAGKVYVDVGRPAAPKSAAAEPRPAKA
jgi:nitrite reductase/ring-hydroxylating ferredoxin subunit